MSKLQVLNAEVIVKNESTRKENGTTKFPNVNFLPLGIQNYLFNSPFKFEDSFINEYIDRYISANSYNHVVGYNSKTKKNRIEKRFHETTFKDNGIKWFENGSQIEKFNYHKMPMIGIDGNFVTWSGKYRGTKHENTKVGQTCYHIGVVQNGEISSVLENINTHTYSLVSMPELEARYLEMTKQSGGLLGLPRFVFFDNRRVFAVEFPFLGNIPMLETDPKKFYLVLWNSIDQRYAEHVGFSSTQLRCSNQFTKKFSFANNKGVRSMAKHTSNYYQNSVDISGILNHFITYLQEKERIYHLFDKVEITYSDVLSLAFKISGIDILKARTDLKEKQNLNALPSFDYTLNNIGLVNRKGKVLLGQILNGIEVEYSRDGKYTLGTIFRGITYYLSNVVRLNLFQSFHSKRGDRAYTTFDICALILIKKGLLSQEEFVNYNKF